MNYNNNFDFELFDNSDKELFYKTDKEFDKLENTKFTSENNFH